MIIKLEGLDSFHFLPGKINVLMTDNQSVYFHLIQIMQGQVDGMQIFDEDYHVISQRAGFIWDDDPITNNDWLQRSIKRLIKNFSEELFNEERTTLLTGIQQIYSQIQEGLFKYDLPLEVSYDADCDRMLKYCRPHLADMVNHSAYDIIATDIKLHQEVHDTAIIGMSNVASYLTPKEFGNLIKLVSDLKMMLFLVNFSEKHNRSYYSKADVSFIDDDFVEWHF